MEKKRGIAMAVCCTVSFFANAQNVPSRELTLTQLFVKVALNSRELKIAEHQLNKREYGIKDAQNDRLPDLSVTVSADKASNMPVYANGLFQAPSQHDVIHTLYASETNLYWSVYEGLKKKNTVKLRELESALEQELFLEKKAAVSLRAVELFLDLYLQNEWERLLKADIQEKEAQLKQVRDFYELGTVLQSDVLRSELELSKRKMTLIEIGNERLQLAQRLNILIGNEDEQQVVPVLDIDTLPQTDNFQTLLQEGRQNAYEEKQSEYHIAAAQKEWELAKSANALKLGVTGSFRFSNPQIFLYPYNDSWYSLGIIGLKASYSLSELYKNRNKRKAAREAVEEAHEHHKKIDDDIRTVLYRDYLAFDESVKYVAIFELNKSYALENARILKDAYFNHTSLITDLLDADVLVLKSEFELKQAQVSVFKNYYKLQYSKGTL